MKLFAKIALPLAAMFTMAACAEKPVVPEEKPDTISVVPGKISLKNEIGAKRQVMVESSTDWTLSTADGKPCEWIESSVSSGANGALVEFVVAKLNDTEAAKTFDFVFKAGKAEAGLKVTLAAMVKIPDEVALSSNKATFESESDVVTSETVVVSSADWTLAPKEQAGYSWVSPDKTSGKDGDKVIFTVDKAKITETSQAIFVFTVGEKSVEYTIDYTQAPPKEIKITSDVAPVLGYVGQDYNVLVTSELPYDALTVDIPAEANWLSKKVVTGGDVAGGAIVILVAQENGTDARREAIVTISGEKATPAQVKISQLPQSTLTPEKASYKISDQGEEFMIPVTTNVEYTVKGDSWIEVVSSDASGVKVKIAATAEARKGVLTLTEKNPGIGTEAVVANIDVVQVTANATFAAKLTGNRLYPKFTGMKNGQTLTYECLFYAEDFDKPQGSVMTLMGIEGMCLVRLGDEGAMNQLNVVVGPNYKRSAGFLSPKKWYHVALVIHGGFSASFELYLDGQKILSESVGFLYKVPYSVPWNPQEPTQEDRSFWIGYSYDSNRDFHGMIAEVRIWDKCLTEAEIQAPGHFYDVDPASDGLFAYWKFNAGGGDTVEDATGHGYTLYGEKGVKYDPSLNYNTGAPGIEWVQADYKK